MYYFFGEKAWQRRRFDHARNIQERGGWRSANIGRGTLLTIALPFFTPSQEVIRKRLQDLVEEVDNRQTLDEEAEEVGVSS